MNIAQLKKAIPILLKHDIVPFIWGKHGIGKTEITSIIAKEMGMTMVVQHLGACESVGDLIGIPYNDGNVFRHSRPEWFPVQGDRTIVFLDEANRSPADVLQVMLPFMLNKTLNHHQLPNECKIISAGNYQDDEYNVTDTSDAALMSRFCHIHLEPTPKEFVLYAEELGLDSISSFIEENPTMLEKENKRPEVKVSPNRRAYIKMIAKLEEEELDDDLRFELYSGIIGDTAAASFMTFKKNGQKKLRLLDILNNYDKVESSIKKFNTGKETRMEMLNEPLSEFVERVKRNSSLLTVERLDNLKKYLLVIPLELTYKFTKSVTKLEFDLKNELLNDKKFVEQLKKGRVS